MAADSDTIWLLDYCGNDTIYDAFWDNSITINTTSPDLTRCFQKTIMTSGSCLLLWLLSLFYIHHLLSLRTLHPWGYISKLNLLKMIAATLLVAVAAFDLVYFTSLLYDGNSSTSPKPVDFVDAALRLITYLLAAIYTHWTFRKGVHSCGVLFFFWFVQLLFSIVSFRSQIIQSRHGQEYGFVKFTYVTFFVQFGLLLVQFIASLFSDLGALHTPEGESYLSEEATPLLAGERDAHIIPRLGLKPCPKLTAPFISELFFGWFTPTVIRGYRKAITYDDIWDIRRGDSSSELVPKFGKAWTTELKKCDVRKRHLYTDEDYLQTSRSMAASWQNGVPGYGSQKGDKAGPSLRTEFIPSQDMPSASKKEKQPSLFVAIAKTLGTYYLYPGILLIIQDFVAFINPLILSALITFVESRDQFAWKGYMYAVGMFFVSLMGVLCIHHHFNLLYTAGMRVRTVLTAAIYRKSLRLSSMARKNATVGEIVNLMSVDTQKIQDSAQFLHYLWSAPLMVALAMYFLWQILGPSSMAGLAFMLVVLPANSIILAKKIREFQKEQMTLKDSRIKIINQVLNGMKVLKLYAWEDFFAQRILEIRQKELAVLKKGAILGAVTYIMWFCSSFLVALLCFATYVLSSPTNILDAQTAFVSLSLIQVLNMPLAILPASIMFIVQSTVSLRRIQTFLLQEEIDPNNVHHDPSVDGAVNIDRGYFSWGEEDRMTLQNISLRIKEGSLVAVVGTVGCGKSSLVSAILGEMQKHQGSVNVKGSTAYVPQQAWIQNMTLKNNILFTKTLNEERYNQVLDACALVPDLQILPGSDQTEIGERGINLSGGQKQRVSLARAVYQDSDIYLLDDPLSAVDAHVGKHIFNSVIGPNGLLKHKTRLLVTHGITYLSKVDTIVVLNDGAISEMGTYDDLISHQGAFAEFIHNFLIETNNSDEEDEELKETKMKLLKQMSVISNAESPPSDGTGSLTGSRDGSTALRRRKRKSTAHSTKPSGKEDLIGGKEKETLAKIRLIEEETAEEGSVKFRVLKSYVTAASSLHAIFAILSLMLFIVAQVGTNIWLSEWTADVIVNGTQDAALRDLRLGVYGGLGGAQTIAVLGLAVSISLGALMASNALHRQLLVNILKCPMSFFDTTPLGRIVNRFSKDIDICDANIPSFTQNLMTTLAPLFSTIIVIIYSTPIFVVVVIPLTIFFIILQRVYVTCARQIKRIDSIKRSPMYAFFSETLNGTSSIRAYQQQRRFTEHSDELLDNSTRVWFEVFTSNRWVGVWAELIGDLVILFAALFAVMQRDSLSPGLVGLSLSFALQISMNLIFTLRSSCELETYIVAVERIQEYTEAPTEADWILPDCRPPRDWPSEGEVAFQDYSTRYRQGMELVLKGVTCKIQPGEMVGFVGRTGAGKSSMTLALFRIIEASGGCIEIDGMNIAGMGLHDLRNKLTIIPQDPVIFSGTLRFNLDPSDKYTDAEIWEALEHAHLKSFVASLADTLNHECGEDGENLSVGQRQLLCLGRALLRKSKILILDEATAAVDLETDDLIQKTIRTEFKGCTVLTIAHRLNTIMDYDRVIVMSEGIILEFDTPEALQNDKNSRFYSMAKDAGLV